MLGDAGAALVLEAPPPLPPADDDEIISPSILAYNRKKRFQFFKLVLERQLKSRNNPTNEVVDIKGITKFLDDSSRSKGTAQTEDSSSHSLVPESPESTTKALDAHQLSSLSEIKEVLPPTPLIERRTRLIVVGFSTVQIREYSRCINDNPGGPRGVPIGIDWDYNIIPDESVDSFEIKRSDYRRSFSNLHLSSLDRVRLMKEFGYSGREIKTQTQIVDMSRTQRRQTRRQMSLEWLWELGERINRSLINATLNRAAKKREREYLDPFKCNSSAFIHEQPFTRIVSERTFRLS